MTDAPPSLSSSRDEHDPLRALLRGVVDLIHRGLHGLESQELEPSDPSTGEPNPPPTGDPTPGDDGAPLPLGAEPTAPSSPGVSDPNEPATPLPTPPTTEPMMPIGTRNFAFAHARITSDGEEVRVSKATGFTPAITHPTDPDPAHCAPADDLPKVARVRPSDPDKLPPNTLLYRLTFPENHQIDREEAVVIASGANRETHSAYDMTAWPMNDRTIEVALELRRPDVNGDRKDVFTVDVLVLRVD